MREQLTAVVIDDERLARKEILQMIADYPQVKVVGEADCVNRAVNVIKTARPDVIFLDIQMPGQSGFELFEKIDINSQIVFITAFDEYAIRAFEVNALDYLVKPVNPERFSKTINRLLSDQGNDKSEERIMDYQDRIFLKVSGNIKIIRINNIKCIIAKGDYTRVIENNSQEHFVLKSLKNWQSILPEKYFLRIHRSTIVNVEYIDKIERWFNYSHRVFMHNIKEPFVTSRRYAFNIKQRLN